jgi:hypothetical protein
MSLKHVDLESAFRRLAERRIDEAIKEGKFDNLPGSGKPLVLDPMPADENARLTWWALRILRNNDFTPHEVRWRKMLDQFRAELHVARDERRVRSLVAAINELVRKINTLGTNALNYAVVSVCLQTELQRLEARLAETAGL